ncbi:MAG: hypothetical protein HN566_02980 [Polaribacter sp.]|nr:hypothetical protein [Polaribacter sp.]
MKNFIKIIICLFFYSSIISNLNAASSYSEEKKIINKECLELGFKDKTPEIAKCRLELLILFRKTLLEEKQIMAAEAQTRLAQRQAQASEAQAKAAEANVKAAEATARAQQSLARDSRTRALDKTILRSQGLISGRCTLANLSSC